MNATAGGMSEKEAREAIINNGYEIVHVSDRLVKVQEKGRRRGPVKTFEGVSFLDIARTFGLHKRPAKQRPTT
jgi:hypothetical protein